MEYLTHLLSVWPIQLWTHNSDPRCDDFPSGLWGSIRVIPGGFHLARWWGLTVNHQQGPFSIPQTQQPWQTAPAVGGVNRPMEWGWATRPLDEWFNLWPGFSSVSSFCLKRFSVDYTMNGTIRRAWDERIFYVRPGEKMQTSVSCKYQYLIV